MRLLDQLFKRRPARVPLTDSELDTFIEERAAAIRKMKPGEIRPAVEYEWEMHGYYLGAKDHKGEWVKRIFISAPVYNLPRYLEEFREAVKDLGP